MRLRRIEVATDGLHAQLLGIGLEHEAVHLAGRLETDQTEGDIVEHPLTLAFARVAEAAAARNPQHDLVAGMPGDGQISVRIKASAINPADLLMFEALYPGPTDLPAFVGIEGAGVVAAVGAGVTEFAVGDHVLSMGRANWAETVAGDANALGP